MKRRVIADLIVNHYRNDEHSFFRNALEVLKEFREGSAKELADYLEFEMSFHYTVQPKKPEERRDFHTDISFEDAESHYIIKGDMLVPQEDHK